MAGKNHRGELSDEEIIHLLRQKMRSYNVERLERYRRNGRVVILNPDVDQSNLTSLRVEPVREFEGVKAYPSASRKTLNGDRLLLVIEVSVIIGIILIFLGNLSRIQFLNRQSAAAMIMPTLSPTPLIQSVVLPSGHTSPTSPGGAQPNYAEIPEHLRPLAQSMANIPIPTPAPEHGNRIQIPAVGVDAPIVQGDSWEQLKKGVAQRIGTANPGQKGNMVLSGHNDIFGEVFRDLDQLKAGDKITIYTNLRAYTYIVTGWQILEPTRVEVMDPTPDATVTLISCYPYLVDTERIVVRANLAET